MLSSANVGQTKHFLCPIASVWTPDSAAYQEQLAYERGGKDCDTFQTSANECKHHCDKDNTA